MRKFSKEFELEILKLYSEGNSCTTIGKMFNKNSTTISRILKRNNVIVKNKVKFKRVQFTNEQRNFIVEAYQNGKTTVEIASVLSSYNTSIRRVLINNNVPLISTKERLKFVSENPFKEGEEFSDYFLGLLITDGCISNKCLTLSLQEQDVYMLENFAKFLSPRVKVNKYFAKAHNKYQYYVKIKEDSVLEYLQKQANFVNKSFDLYLKTPLNYNILRGIIDGDGYLGFNKNQFKISIFSKSKLFINQIEDFLLKEGFNPKITMDKNNLFNLSLYRQKEILKFGTFLYSDATIFLKRKYSKWLAFLEIKSEKIS